MEKKITYKKQGNGQDSWIIMYLDEDGNNTQLPEIVFKNPNIKEVELWKLKGILSIMGLSAQIDLALNNLPEPNKTFANLVWNNGNIVHSDSPTVKFVQGVLKLTDEDVTGIFEQAEAINI